MPGPTSLPRSGDINGLLYAGERRAGERALGPEEKGKRKGKRVGVFVGRLRQGVCVQDSLGVGDLHRVPTRVRDRKGDVSGTGVDLGASGLIKINIVCVPRARRQGREGGG